MNLERPTLRQLGWSGFWVIYELGCLWWFTYTSDDSWFDFFVVAFHLIALVWFTKFLLWRIRLYVQYPAIIRELEAIRAARGQDTLVPNIIIPM